MENNQEEKQVNPVTAIFFSQRLKYRQWCKEPFRKQRENQLPPSLLSSFEYTALIVRNRFNSRMKAKSCKMLPLPAAQLHSYIFTRILTERTRSNLLYLLT